MEEIKRKWLVKEMPDISKKLPIYSERYFLYLDDQIEIRVEFKQNKYAIERKVQGSNITKENNRFEITAGEFEHLKRLCTKSVIRESYTIGGDGLVALKVYREEYDGLIRAEVEFKSEGEAKNFVPPVWFGCEITDTDLGMDKRLISLSRDEFRKLLEKLSVC